MIRIVQKGMMKWILQDTALLQQADIGPASNIFYDIFVGQKTWAYSIPVNRPMPRRNYNLMALNETNVGSHIFKSLRNTCPP
ncbi:unnamed protein product [Prunus armeniaca]